MLNDHKSNIKVKIGENVFAKYPLLADIYLISNEMTDC